MKRRFRALWEVIDRKSGIIGIFPLILPAAEAFWKIIPMHSAGRPIFFVLSVFVLLYNVVSTGHKLKLIRAHQLNVQKLSLRLGGLFVAILVLMIAYYGVFLYIETYGVPKEYIDLLSWVPECQAIFATIIFFFVAKFLSNFIVWAMT